MCAFCGSRLNAEVGHLDGREENVVIIGSTDARVLCNHAFTSKINTKGVEEGYVNPGCMNGASEPYAAKSLVARYARKQLSLPMRMCLCGRRQWTGQRFRHPESKRHDRIASAVGQLETGVRQIDYLNWSDEARAG